MATHDNGEHLCDCEACVLEDLALLASHPDPIGQIADEIHQAPTPIGEQHP